MTDLPKFMRGGGAYFNGMLKFQKDEIMVDCGAYDGDTALAFVDHCPHYQKIYALEPNVEVLPKLKERAKDLKIEIFEVGAYSRKDTLSFQSQQSGCSTLKEEGEFHIAVDCIDHLVADEKNPITFIKMDIEGSELEALKGASQTIKKYKPKLAICVYHRKNDLIEIPKLIKSLRPDYRLYLRSHQCIPEDSVLYAF